MHRNPAADPLQTLLARVAVDNLSELGVAAVEYAIAGWPVFPIMPRQKTPLFGSAHKKGDPQHRRCSGECGQVGHGFHDATTDIELVETWWTRNPDANIGLATGHHFDVWDVDPDGVIPMIELIESTGRDPWDGARACFTPRGGLHLYVNPTGHGNRADFGGEHRPGFDWRGYGGYVVAPPSIVVNPKRNVNARYEWIGGARNPIIDCPPWLESLVRPVVKEPQTRAPAFFPVRIEGDDDATELGAWRLDRACERIKQSSKGSRQDTAFFQAMSIYRLVLEGQIKKSVADSWLAGAMADAGFPDKGIKHTLDNARNSRVARGSAA